MLATYKKLWQILDVGERRQAIFLFAMVMAMSCLQLVGVASVMPFMSVAANPHVIETNRYLAATYAFFDFADTGRFLLFLGVGVFLVLIVSIAFKAFTTYGLVRFAEMRNYSLSRNVMASYLGQPYDWFLDRQSADLGKTILSETEQVIRGALSPAIHLVAESAVIVTLVILLIIVDPLLASATAIGLGGAYGAIYVVLRRYLSRIGAERLHANRQRFGAVQETFGSIKDVKIAGIEGPLLRRFDGPARRFAQTRAAELVATQMPRFALEALAFGGMVAIVVYLMSGPGGLQQALPVLSVYAFAAYRLMPALQSFYGHLVALRFAGPALEALHRDLMDLRPAGKASLSLARARPLGLKHRIRLSNVNYAYPLSDRPAIRDFTLDIPACTTVGLVGKTGCGKTTAVDVILGLLRPQQGTVEADGTPIDANNLRAWQATIGYVAQAVFLADASVAANIAFGVPPDKVDRLAVERAARVANIHDFVVEDLPHGYDTGVGERGVRLSGGQRQRIGIARALYHDPELLILDEATSALDYQTEDAVMDAVNNLGGTKTIILIAHRLSTVARCDQVVRMEAGRIVAVGTYDEVALAGAGTSGNAGSHLIAHVR